MEQSHKHQYHAGHGCGYGQAVEPELGYYIIYNNNEGAGRAADLYGVAAEERHQKTAYDGSDKAYRGAYAGCYAECYCERKGYNAHYDAGDYVVFEFGHGVLTQRLEQFGAEVDCTR